MFYMGLVEEVLELGPCIEFGGFPSPLLDVFVEGGCMCKNGDTFKHHFRIGNRLPYCTRQDRGSAGLYGPIIFTAFSSMSILYIAP